MMKQLKMFEDEVRVARKLVKADYKLCLLHLKRQYSHETAKMLLKYNFFGYYFSIARHNAMIDGIVWQFD